MTLQAISAAMNRLADALRRKPGLAVHEDSGATARWESGLRVVSTHPNGMQVLTDMPAELGGAGGQITPGWLMRAGLAACVATRIAMAAASENIALSVLEVSTRSRTDARGFFGMADADGVTVDAGPKDMAVRVRIGAPGIPSQRLRTLVETSHRCSPVSDALCRAVPVALEIDVDGA
ncbi:MAG: OsmC family protein [Gammaproteobacteria bacterium]|nr:OsmC family protein [Gammaproteobacteria bacterium]